MAFIILGWGDLVWLPMINVNTEDDRNYNQLIQNILEPTDAIYKAKDILPRVGYQLYNSN